MRNVTRRHRISRQIALSIAVAAVSSACASVPAELQDSRLALQRGTLSGAKYSLDGSEPEGVYSFLGMYQQPYLELLSEQPDALAVAESAKPYQYASLAVLAVGGIYGISELIAAANSDSDSFAGIDEADSHLTNVLVAMVGMVAANAVLQIPIRNRLYDSARMYNEGLDATDRGPSLLEGLFGSLPNSIGWNPVTRGVDVGWAFH